MGQSIAIASQKGGVGKTTVALNLAVALAESGRSTLLVDLDPQGGIAHALLRGDAEMAGLAELIMKQCTAEEAVQPTLLPALSLLPRGRVDPIDYPHFERALGEAGVLREAFEPLRDKFDLIVLDTPAGMGMVTRGALGAADFVLVPFQAEPMALRSIHQSLRVIEHVRAEENPQLELLGIVATMVDKKQATSMGSVEEIWSGFAGVLDTLIPRDEVFLRASQEGLPIAFLAGKVSPEARRFELLAEELEHVMRRLRREESVHVDEYRQARQLL